jgi:hypothetical protein
MLRSRLLGKDRMKDPAQELPLAQETRPRRRPYAKPEVTCFGRVEDLTRATGTSNREFSKAPRTGG